MTEKLHCAEFVFPGHPDKLSDAIADALVQEAGRREKRALVGVEIAVHRNKVFVTGRIGCDGAEDIEVSGLARDVYRTAGYSEAWKPLVETLEVNSDLCLGPLEDGEAEFRSVADDQSICTGYATAIHETNYLPVEHWLASKLGRRLANLRLKEPALQLGPDGKLIVMVREHDGGHLLEGFSCSLQQMVGASDIELHRSVREILQDEMVQLARDFDHLSPQIPERLSVNGAGAFEVGGPEGDNGLAGKKLVVDAYGPRVPIGGGALSGKDFFKVDRAGAIHARRIAKAIVVTGASSEALVRLAWFPGDTTARIVSIEGASGEGLAVRPWQDLFDLSLEGSGDAWTGAADLLSVARFGHFTDERLPWEQLAFGSLVHRTAA